MIQLQQLHVGKHDNAEGFIDFPEINIFDRELGHIQSGTDCRYRSDGEVDRLDSGIGHANHAGHGLDCAFLGLLGTHQKQSCSTIIHGACIGSGDGAIGRGIKNSGNLANLVKLDTERVCVISYNRRLPLSLRNRNHTHFIKKHVLIDRCLSALVALDRVVILFFARETHLTSTMLANLAHVNIIVSIPKTIIDDTIHSLGVSIRKTLSQVHEVVRYLGHTFHATGHHARPVAKHNCL
mmetsp:Transcript_12754/g.32508  ORF Transcript_12754/g.32508 Transcript_12754/m.32508 type:complete len:238 (+) Transcript_12754:337-1050(+)